MLKFFFGALALVLMQGCSTVAEGTGTVVRKLVELNQPVRSLNDDSNARWARDAKATVSLRTPKFFANSDVARALIASCASGKWAEVLVYAGGTQEVAVLKGTCVQVFVSDNPELSRGFDVLLLDGDTVVTEGRMVAVVNVKSQQEYAFRQFVKRTARQLN
jgi:hypothetical protein